MDITRDIVLVDSIFIDFLHLQNQATPIQKDTCAGYKRKIPTTKKKAKIKTKTDMYITNTAFRLQLCLPRQSSRALDDLLCGEWPSKEADVQGNVAV